MHTVFSLHVHDVDTIDCGERTKDEEKPEIQIGMPMDVKHVAHVGADGLATKSPSWVHTSPSIFLVSILSNT
ncbi:putative CRIB domain-containing protein [Helianthus anomalus]